MSFFVIPEHAAVFDYSRGVGIAAELTFWRIRPVESSVIKETGP